GALIEGLPTSRVLLLTNYRPEFSSPWAARGYFGLLRLDPLEEESAEELLSALLGPDAALMELRSLLLQRAGGNPFFTEELVRSLVDRGALAGHPGAYQPAGDISRLELPPTVQGVLAGRIDRLEPDAKRTLQTAAVIGKDFILPLLERVSDLSPEGLATALDALKDSEFIYEQAIYPEVEYTFKHALTQEVAAQGLLAERRRALHRLVGEAIEGLYADRLDEYAGALAHHFAQSDDQDKAVRYLHLAGVRMMNWPGTSGMPRGWFSGSAASCARRCSRRENSSRERILAGSRAGASPGSPHWQRSGGEKQAASSGSASSMR